MAISDSSWDGSASNYADAEAFCRASLINENTGDPKGWTKDKCHLPYKTASGEVSRNGVHAAASRLNQTQVSPALKKAAARKLVRLYGELKEPVPPIVRRIAGS